MKKLRASALIMALLGVTSVYANDVYVEQVGSSSTITLTQQGTGNNIGDNVDSIYIGSGSNTISVSQIGDSNSLAMVVNGSATDVLVTVNGSNNTKVINCGTTSASGCSGSDIKQILTGDSNNITQNLGAGANHTSWITVTGDTNTFTHTSTSTGTTVMKAELTGNLNTVNVTQSGMTAQNVILNSTGNLNVITINQSN